jgi:hypothetical protein
MPQNLTPPTLNAGELYHGISNQHDGGADKHVVGLTSAISQNVTYAGAVAAVAAASSSGAGGTFNAGSYRLPTVAELSRIYQMSSNSLPGGMYFTCEPHPDAQHVTAWHLPQNSFGLVSSKSDQLGIALPVRIVSV